jgi:hypothetical protein
VNKVLLSSSSSLLLLFLLLLLLIVWMVSVLRRLDKVIPAEVYLQTLLWGVRVHPPGSSRQHRAAGCRVSGYQS